MENILTGLLDAGGFNPEKNLPISSSVLFIHGLPESFTKAL